MSSTNPHHPEIENPFAAAAANAGASLSYPVQASALRKGGYVLIKLYPCKISKISTSKPGKHGHAKVAIEACDVSPTLTLPSRRSHHNCDTTNTFTISYHTSQPTLTPFQIFTHRKYEDSQPAHSTVDVPIVTKREYQLLNIEDDGFLSLFSYEDGETKDDVNVPEGEVGEKAMKLWGSGKRDVAGVVVASMGMEMVVEVKENVRG